MIIHGEYTPETANAAPKTAPDDMVARNDEDMARIYQSMYREERIVSLVQDFVVSYRILTEQILSVARALKIARVAASPKRANTAGHRYGLFHIESTRSQINTFHISPLS